jgi:hypothetical protein
MLKNYCGPEESVIEEIMEGSSRTRRLFQQPARTARATLH